MEKPKRQLARGVRQFEDLPLRAEEPGTPEDRPGLA
jgi:hypothetical protein